MFLPYFARCLSLKVSTSLFSEAGIFCCRSDFAVVSGGLEKLEKAGISH